jgi:hypothetical protein
MKVLTRQQIFDKITKHMLTQRAKAKRTKPTSTCVMYSENGLRCAVGCLVPKKVYQKNEDLRSAILNSMSHTGQTNRIEPELVKHGIGEKLNEYGLFQDKDFVGFLLDLQGVHDGHRVKDWPKMLRAVAKNHNLDEKAVTKYGGWR